MKTETEEAPRIATVSVNRQRLWVLYRDGTTAEFKPIGLTYTARVCAIEKLAKAIRAR